jgi:glycosyltransferase involved in cell wall biosynthesis
MKKVLFHSLTIPPDQVSTGKLVADIASKFKENDISVEILASTPQYRFDSEKFSDKGLTKISRNIYRSSYNGVKITHLSSSKRSFSRTKRFAQWIIYHLKSINYLIKNRNKFDTIFIFSYPPTMNLIAIFTKKILRKKTIYSVWELYPEIANKLNELNFNFLHIFFKSIDNYCLKNIDYVVANSDQLKKYLIEHRKIQRNKIKVIYHFANEPEVAKSKKISKHIMYAGNLGTPQNIESFINTFSNSAKNYNLTIFGSGSQYQKISDLSSPFIKVNSYVTRKKLATLTSDIPFALVSLSSEITVEGFPGKTFDYLKMNKILIGYSNPESSLAKFIEKYQLGINIDPDDKNIDIKLGMLEDEKYLEKIYSNISEVNNHFANVDLVVKQYMELI